MRMVIRSWWVARNGIRKGRCRRFTIRLMVLFQRSVMFISLPKAARPSARWMLGRGSSERRRLGSPRSLRQAQGNFLEVLNKQFPESKPNSVPPPADLKSVFDLVSSLELVSAKEEPDGTAQLVVKTTRQTPEGRTTSREDT